MRESFQSYHRPSDAERKELWRLAFFVFDTNVLLSLYSFTDKIRDEMFRVFEALKPRIWIPYHVGLEYQRNRIRRISDVASRIKKSRDGLEHTKAQIQRDLDELKLAERELGLGDLEARISAVTEAHDRLISAITLAAGKLPSVSLDDPIRDRLSKIFEGRLGPPPKDQKEVDEFTRDAAERFANQVPPGFRDESKEPAHFMDRTFKYERKHGDLILWRQILRQISSEQWKRVVFVTNDNKEDWWWREGHFTLGPRPELIQEATAAMNGGIFWMMSAEKFLREASDELKTPVSPEALSRVAEVGEQFSSPSLPDRATSEGSRRQRAVEGVVRWLRNRYPEHTISSGAGPGLLLTRGQSHIQVDILPVRRRQSFLKLRPTVQEMVSAAQFTNLDLVGKVSEQLLFMVYTDLPMGERWPHGERLRELAMEEVQGTRVQVLIGEINRGGFMLLHHIMSGLGR